MRIYDISVTITKNLPVWPGNPHVVLERVEKLEEGANSNGSRLDMIVHSGTHVDAPYHFLPAGSTVEQLPLDILVGPARVINLESVGGHIDAQKVQKAGISAGTERILFKTRNSRLWQHPENGFQADFIGITLDGALELIHQGVRLVGIDYLSIAPYKQSRPIHVTLLEAGVVVVEGLDLSAVPEGSYYLCCLPLKLGGAEGSPARAILIEDL